MNEISCEELKLRIDQNDDFRLVNCLTKEKFEMKHIPGSLNFPLTPENFKDNSILEKEIRNFFSMQDDIVVYCTDAHCQASIFIYRHLEKLGYSKISRFSDGIAGWEEEGYKCEGTRVLL